MSSWLFMVSILSGLLSYTAFNIGFALEKKAIRKLIPEDQKSIVTMMKQLMRSKTWLLGFFLTILSIVLYFIALIWAPLSAIAPLSGFGLVILITYAHVDLQESFNYKEIIGIILVIVGISVSSYFTSLSTEPLNWNEWNVLAHSYGGLILILSSIALCFILPIIFFFKLKKHTTYSFAFVAGVAAGIQAIVVKGIIIWFSSTDSSPAIYVLLLYIAGFLLTALGSTGGLQLAFRKGKVTNVMALYNGFITIIPILFGGLVLFEWQVLSVLNQAILGIAISIALIGILILSLEHRHQSLDNNR
jgi:multidrug transporter EmrE-like cation transporter